MTYEELRHRCRRIMGMSPDCTESLLDFMKLLDQFRSGSSRALAAEMLAREMAEYIEERHNDAARKD
jgi:hypothetical protein